jgi:hypothetical protein
MDENSEPRIRKPVGAVLSVRVPRSLAVAADEFARERSMTLSELVRIAVEDYLSAPPPRIRWTLYGSTIDASLLLSSPAAGSPDQTRGRTPTETVKEWKKPLELTV